MQKIIKTYESIEYMQLSTSFFPGGKEVRVHFEGGSSTPFPRNGTFTTSDEALIEEIEKSNGFGTQYKLKHIIEPETQEVKPVTGQSTGENDLDKPETPVIQMTPAQWAQEPTGEIVPAVPANTTQAIEDIKSEEAGQEAALRVDHVTTVQEAKEYLVQRFPEITQREVANRALVLDMAKQKGVSFPNLPLA